MQNRSPFELKESTHAKTTAGHYSTREFYLAGMHRQPSVVPAVWSHSRLPWLIGPVIAETNLPAESVDCAFICDVSERETLPFLALLRERELPFLALLPKRDWCRCPVLQVYHHLEYPRTFMRSLHDSIKPGCAGQKHSQPSRNLAVHTPPSFVPRETGRLSFWGTVQGARGVDRLPPHPGEDQEQAAWLDPCSRPVCAPHMHSYTPWTQPVHTAVHTHCYTFPPFFCMPVLFDGGRDRTAAAAVGAPQLLANQSKHLRWMCTTQGRTGGFPPGGARRRLRTGGRAVVTGGFSTQMCCVSLEQIFQSQHANYQGWVCGCIQELEENYLMVFRKSTGISGLTTEDMMAEVRSRLGAAAAAGRI